MLFHTGENMFLNKISKTQVLTSLILFVCLGFSSAKSVFAQDKSIRELTLEARRMVDENRYLDALPLLEQIVLSYPDNGEIWADFGIAIISTATTINDTVERKKELERGVKALLRAKKLGTKNPRALYFLDEFENSDGTDNFSNKNPEVEKALRKGELYFGRGEYDKAFKYYETAHKLDPKNYEAMLFMGDCFYVQGKFKESEKYFAQAVEINPEVESAYRYWGDALMSQNKNAEGLEKFLDAFIRDPFSLLSWNNLKNWAERTKANYEPIIIAPPGVEEYGTLDINEKLLKTDNGTDRWLLYNRNIAEQMAKKTATDQSFTLADEIKAWRAVADAVRRDIKSGKIKYPDQNLVNLLKIDDENLLEPYILLLRPQGTFGDDYVAYREKNPQKIKQLIRKFILNLKD